jgi:hypothetical protein
LFDEGSGGIALEPDRDGTYVTYVSDKDVKK